MPASFRGLGLGFRGLGLGFRGLGLNNRLRGLPINRGARVGGRSLALFALFALLIPPALALSLTPFFSPARNLE